MMTHHTFLIISLVVLILISGFFSSSETAMMSINRYRLRNMVRKGHVAAKRLSALLERPDRILGVILIGNTFANILASAITTMLAVYYFGQLGVLIASISLTLLILIFAEIAPKTFAVLHPQRLALPAALPLTLLLKILYPLIWLINGIANGILLLFGIHVKNNVLEPFTVEELRTIVHEATGKLSTNYQQMLLRILDLEIVTVEDIMIPRYEIVGIDLEDDWDKILNQLKTPEYSFLPLYRENINNVVGMLNLRKILSVMQDKKIDRNDLRTLADEAYYIPEGAQLSRQLLHFQDQQKSIGLVVDEYGDIQGLITVQDILTEIVGEVAQDIEDIAEMIKKQNDGSVIVDGRASIRDLNRHLELTLPTEGPKTLSGLIIENLETFPEPGIASRIAGYPMEVKQISGKIIRLVQIWPNLKKDSKD